MDPSPSCWFFWSCWLPLMLAVAVADQQAEDCSGSANTCGNFTISDPFWLTDMETGRTCGSPDFEVTCYNNTPVLPGSGALSFAIIDIAYKERSLRVADLCMLELVHASNSCSATWNTSVKLGSSFRITPDNLDLVLYNCTDVAAARRDGALVETRMRCGNQSEVFVGMGGSYNETSDYARYAVKGCEAIVVPVLGGAANGEVNMSDYEQLITDGFLMTWDDPPPLAHRNHKRRFTLVVSLSTVASLVSACLAYLMYRQKKKIKSAFCRIYSTNTSNAEEMLRKCGTLALKRYRYSEVKKITRSFKDEVGEGGYGVVYKGSLEDGRIVAVKLLKGSKGNGQDFLNEVMSIGRTSHVNIVSLLGFCLEGSQRALIYEYMSNGSLQKHIYSESAKLAIGWEMFLKIAVGIARGLEYLHQGCNTRIIHFDIKPNNILLDHEFCPKIADFGLAKLCDLKDNILSMAETRGTVGFIAPEVFSRGFGVVSTKSDVYSYGMMLLQMVREKKNLEGNADNSSETFFPHWVYDRLAKDLHGSEVTHGTEEIVRKMTMVGLWCIQMTPESRPAMSRVIEMLERNIGELEMPPKPFFCSPVYSTNVSSYTPVQVMMSST